MVLVDSNHKSNTKRRAQVMSETMRVFEHVLAHPTSTPDGAPSLLTVCTPRIFNTCLLVSLKKRSREWKTSVRPTDRPNKRVFDSWRMIWICRFIRLEHLTRARCVRESLAHSYRQAVKLASHYGRQSWYGTVHPKGFWIKEHWARICVRVPHSKPI